jgi:hypothetical protein
MGFIKVNLKSNKSIATLVTVNLFDSELTSIGIGSVKTTLSSGESEIILSFMIPDDAAIGPADIFANAFSDWPSSGGIPLTNEASIVEFIETDSVKTTSEQKPPTTVKTTSEQKPPTTVKTTSEQKPPTTLKTTISASVNKLSYENGEIVTITGNIQNYDPLSLTASDVTYMLKNSNGDIAQIGQLSPASDGYFQFSIVAGGPLWKSGGEYTVDVNYGAEKKELIINYVGAGL